MRKFVTSISLGIAVAAMGIPVAYSAEQDEDQFIEEITVTGVRGEENVLDMPMTVTGFNKEMIEKLGIQNTQDLEVLVPGLQIGNRTQGGGKGEDDHYYMRGLGSERTVNFFSDTSVAVYVDGVYTDQTFGIDGGMFDVERVEVARGPQGTTGGRSAIAGAINFHTRKPTDTFDLRTKLELTDVATQRLQVAFGGPIGDTDFSYRLGLSSYTGDGRIENQLGRDAGEPGETIIAPQLRWKNDRWDVTARYHYMEDKGTPMVSLPLAGEDTRDEFIMDAAGNRLCAINEATGLEECQRNPFFGIPSAPAVANCTNLNAGGDYDQNANVVCDPSDLQWKVALNAPIDKDSTSKSVSIDVSFALTDQLSVDYKYGYHDVVNDNLNDSDQRGRTGGGVCLFNHPAVIAGIATAGQTSRLCAQDQGGVGLFTDTGSRYIFTSEQWSHEITLLSDFDGPFNFTLGANLMENDEPYVWIGSDYGSSSGDWLYQDTSATCEANLVSLYGAGGSVSGGDSWLLRDLYTNAATMTHAQALGQVFACPGSPELAAFSGTGKAPFDAHMNNQNAGFYGAAVQRAFGAYFNVEYQLNDEWQLFGGVRYSDDEKDRTEASFGGALARETADPTTICSGGAIDMCDNGFAVISVGVRDSSVFPGRGDLNWSKTTWNVGAEYRPNDDMMYYGRVSTGYRAGGSLGYGQTTAPFQYDAEELTNYEAGIKGLYFDNALQLSASVFLQDFDSHWVFASRMRNAAEQAMNPDLGPLTGEIATISGTKIKGLELEGALRLSDRLTLRGFYNYLDGSIGSYPSLLPYANPTEPGTWVQLPWQDSQGNNQVSWIFGSATPTELGGKQLVNSPKHKTSLTLAYDTPIPADWGNLELLTIANYRSEKFVEPANFDAYAVPSYTRWDVRANWVSPGGAWQVTGYVQNLLDEAAIMMWSPREGVDAPWGTIVEPREFGLSVSWRNM